MTLSSKDVKTFSLSLVDTSEAPHFHKTAIKVAGKIFVTLSDDDFFVFKISLEDQALLTEMFPDNFTPSKGWGKHGWTEVSLIGLTRDHMEDVVLNAWREVRPKRQSFRSE